MKTTKLRMTDVYDEGEESLPLYLRADSHDSLIVDDAPSIEGGSYNVIIENRHGVPYMMIWPKSRFGNDPKHIIRLDTGEIE